MDTIELRKKICTKCGIEKIEFDFYPNRAKPSGLADQCKECSKAEKREWYKHNRETQKRRVRKYSEAKKEEIDPTYGKHKCNKCGKKEPDVVFNLRKVQGRYYKRHLCTTCFAVYRKETRKPKKDYEELKKRQSLWGKHRRSLPQFVAGFVLENSKRSDKVKGRQNDLDIEFVKSMLSAGACSYCGESSIRLTLDRIDNAIGHLKTNVIVACVRCNSIRSNMPFAAWKKIVPAIRSTRLKGLFGDWQGRRPSRVDLRQWDLDETLWSRVGEIARTAER
jgi:hypothetical protein